MKIYILIPLITIFFLSFSNAQKKDSIIVIESTEHRAEQLYNNAVKSYEEKAYTEAINFLQLSIAENQTFSDAYFLLAVIYSENNNKQQAIKTLNDYILQSEYKDTAYYLIAKIYYEDKQYEDAIMNLTKVIEIQPNFAHAFNDRGSAKRMLEKYDEAIDDYSMAIVIDKKAIYYNNRGSVKMKIEKYKEAIDDYSAAIVLDSNYFIALNNRGVAKIEIKDYKGAITDFTLCLEKQKDYYSAISNRGIAYYKSKRYKEAIADFDTLIAVNPSDGTSYLHRANTKEMIRDKEGACQDWQKAADLGIDVAKNYVKNQCNQ